ncbi:MAG TPA: hypothetical protein VGV13_01465 [Methylomirabilota bacterium]|jgi:hypothetical protein|nr:hypothetical protein [Methylomirabilota bacterium]
MDITRDVMRLRAEGQSRAAARAAIDAKYLRSGRPTPTPPP